MEIKCEIVCSETSKVKCNLTLTVQEESTVRDVKDIIQGEIGTPSDRLQLKFEEQVMENERKLSDYSIQGGSGVQLMVMKDSDTDNVSCVEEVDIMQKNYCRIFELISEPAKFAARLYAAGLITTELRETAMNEMHLSCYRAMRLVSAVENQIKLFPQENFRKFMKILCEEESYRRMARQLQPELAEECIQEIENEMETMSIENSDSPDLPPPLLALKEEEVRLRIKSFEKRFKKIALKLQKELRHKLSQDDLEIEDIRQSITLLPNEIKSEYQRFLDKITTTKALTSCEDVEQLFIHLNSYWSFFDYSLIEPLIEDHGSEDLQKTMAEYVDDMREFRQNTVVETFAHVWRGDIEALSQDKFTTLRTKLKKRPAHCTLEELDRLRKEFCAAYHLSESALMVYRYENGSVIIVWLLPVQFTRDLMSTIKRVPIEVFCISRELEYLYVGEEKVYSDQVFEEITVPGQYCLNRLLDERGSECLNGMDEHPYTHALVPGPLKYLQSDVDEQLIISFTFKKPIKLHSIHLSGPLDGRSPKTVKLFINHPQCLDFNQAESLAPVEELDLSEEDTDYHKDSSIPLKHVKGKNVSSLTVFIKDNQGGGDTTVVHHIGLFGSPTEACDVSQLEGGFGDAGGFSCKHETCPNS